VRSGETILLASQNGPAYFLVPVMGDIVAEDRELRRAMATASLRSNWRAAGAADRNEAAVDAEIEAEIDSVRSAGASSGGQ
jgi:hypothetical protein